MKVIVGVGGSGSQVSTRVKAALSWMLDVPESKVLGQSPVYENPAVGGVTLAAFANAAVLLETSLSLERLWQTLHQLERKQGRVRLLKNSARSLDLDILWAEKTSKQSWLQVPHPRFLERDFALLPAIDAWTDAALSPPSHWEMAARSLRPFSRMRQS
ncbi:MAG: 2-amino-4-hydroxy-6-hydroxymethyldihydropteridine diphosphokinase [Myxococcales bacterium]|nr:2-amino-4-hydroxy-6-hydroxymethyldihydropteridine diphosphokinase [Myxococcales bacterium]|tara:strand:- start:2668 stop:3141 length:474 start_codon:yes stop_codon:yes gene_type:complete